MKKLVIFILCFAAVAQAAAQTQKANYALALKFEDEIEKFNNSFYPSIQYINGTDRFWYSMKTSDGTEFYIVDPSSKSKKQLFDVKELLGKISSITNVAYNASKFSLSGAEFDKKLPVFIFEHGNGKYSYNYVTKELKVLPKEKSKGFGPSAYRYSPDSLYIVFAKNHNLYIMGNKEKGMDTTQVQVTTDGTRYNSYAKYPNEESSMLDAIGIWFKNSKQFLITRENEERTDMMYLVDMEGQPRPTLKSYKYSCPGDQEIDQYSFQLLDVETKKVIDIPAEKWKDQYVQHSYDSNDGERLYFYRTKRTWDEKELCMYNLKTKEVKVLFNEVDKPFFDYVIAQTHYLNDGKEILFRSERTGYGHFYLYDGLTGKLKKQITSGNYVTGQIEKIDTLKRDIYFYGFGREKGIDPYYYMLYKTNLDKGGIELLTPENGNHKVEISKSSKYFVDTYSRVDMEPVSVVKNIHGKVLQQLDKGDFRELYARGWRKPERFTVKAADGVTDLYGVMWKPIDFDSTKKYPIISEVYPGPQFEYVPTSFTIKESYATKLAQLGFIVIQVGHRGGTPLRGKFYHRQSYRNMRDYALADDKAAIEELARRYPFINVKKVGIYGHSGGGFMSTAALCTYPDFYTAAVSSAGNHDNNIFNRGWVEMNNGIEEIITTKKDSTGVSLDSVSFKARKIQTNMELAPNYKGHLLLVHGLMDNNVHPAHSMRMAKALMKAGKNFDMILLPESTHGFRGEEETFFERKMWRYFSKYLLDDPSGDYQSDLNKFYEKTK